MSDEMLPPRLTLSGEAICIEENGGAGTGIVPWVDPRFAAEIVRRWNAFERDRDALGVAKAALDPELNDYKGWAITAHAIVEDALGA